MKYLLSALPVALALALTACGNTTPSGTTNQSKAAVSTPSTQTVLDQLSKVNQNVQQQGLPLQLVSYEVAAPLASTADINTVESKMVEGQSLVPQYDGLHTTSFKLSSIQDRMKAQALDPAHQQDVVKNIQKMADSTFKVGQGTMTLTWKNGDQTFKTTAVYDEKGIVYDNMLSNIVVVKDNTPEAGDVHLKVKGQMQAQSSAFTATVLDYEIQWIWGSRRGNINIKHTIIWNGSNTISSQYGTADAWMTAGSADAQTHNKNISAHSYALMAWGYGWATPTADFHISYNSGKGAFDVGVSGVGSKGCGQGGHYIYI